MAVALFSITSENRAAQMRGLAARASVQGMSPTPSAERHFTQCGGALDYKGLKEIHAALMRKMGCEAYVCRCCGHVEFF